MNGTCEGSWGEGTSHLSGEEAGVRRGGAVSGCRHDGTRKVQKIEHWGGRLNYTKVYSTEEKS